MVMMTLIISSCTSSNHDQKDHATFMSVPIDGTVNNFIMKMTAKGFSDPAVEGDLATMAGSFLSKPCYIYIKFSPTSKIVQSVTVGYDEVTKWEDLEAHYYAIKALYIEKYGEPDDVVETVSEGKANDKLQALKDFEAAFHCSFRRAKGNVSIFMDSFNPSVNVYYADAINLEKSAKERKAEIEDQI
jgi:hypothetical protein